MAESPQKRTTSNFSKALKQINAIESYYAKMICNMSGSVRLKIYRKIASLMSNRFSLVNALDLLHDGASNGGKNPSEPMAIAIATWALALQNGLPFSEALRGWAPDRERLMLSVGDVSDLEGAIRNLIRVTEGSTKMLRPIVSAIAYPAFLILMATFIIYGIGAYMVPPMIEAAPGVRWTGVAADLAALSDWIIDNWAFAFAVLPTFMLVTYATIGVWTGPTRAFIDKAPPWSLYKIFVGITWLLAMSALVKGGSPVSSALRALRKDSSRYLKERIDKTLAFVNNGDNLGQALSKTNLEFPDAEVIGDLKIYSELDNFEEALEALANTWLDESVFLIEQKASILNMIALLAISGLIAWSVLGVFEMQDQITTSMGM